MLFYLLNFYILWKTVDMKYFLLSTFNETFHIMKYFMTFLLTCGCGDGFGAICGAVCTWGLVIWCDSPELILLENERRDGSRKYVDKETGSSYQILLVLLNMAVLLQQLWQFVVTWLAWCTWGMKSIILNEAYIIFKGETISDFSTKNFGPNTTTSYLENHGTES